MILIMFILLLLALTPLICQQIYTAVVHEHLSIPTGPHGPAHKQVMFCSSALTMTIDSEKLSSLSGSRIQNGHGTRCTVVVAHPGFAATLYTSPPAP